MSTLSKILAFCRTNDTTCFVDELFGIYYGDCSKLHDRRYENKRLTRRQADILFHRCLKRKIPKKKSINRYFFMVLFYAFYLFVRIFGKIFYNN